ncbi:cilia- and flagella-associated protein 54 [Salarias fasciatus]|uniref:cilia- and flagella-associated protein 54 n=1 Tax=Salarias fasciatus TaxID=181472 RepID=UPI001176BD0A|nr:cilia- and flagella-associated protein 54 [Salarias fasciatus]
MELPASYYGNIDRRNPVITGFKRDIHSFMTLMRQVTSNQEHGSYAKGIKVLVEIWRKYKHRLPTRLYQEHMLQIADFLFGLKLYQLAQWHGYSLHLLEFTSVKITDITDVGHFMASFFPEGFDADQDVFAMKIRAMQGCALCIFEEEKKHSVLSQEGLQKLLRVLNFIRIMMQALQQNEAFYHTIYDGSVHIYSICRYLMTMKCSAQALEYLLWASISVELSLPLMTTKYLPAIVTLYCAVCHCYYDNQAEVQAEEFARRALGKINELAKLDEQSEISQNKETQRAYKEASIKLGTMIFKRAVFEGRKKPKFSLKSKGTLKDISHGPWPRTQTERMLLNLFDGRAGQFLAILEALQNSSARPLQMKMPDDPELQEVIVELQFAGISILSGVASTSEQRCDKHPSLSPTVLTPTSDLLDQAIKGEDAVPIMSAVRFVKLLLQYKQPDSFIAGLVREMLHILSGVDGHSFRKAERELALLDSYNTVLSSQRRPPREDSRTPDRRKSSLSLGDEFTALVHTLHKAACDCAPDEQADGDLVLDIAVFLWSKMKEVIQKSQLSTPEFTLHLQTTNSYDQLLLCLSMLCKAAFSCDLAVVDCEMMFEMVSTLRILLDSAPERFTQAPQSGFVVNPDDDKCSSVELLQKVCEAVEKGRETVRWDMLLSPQDPSAVTDFAYMQKCNLLSPSTTSMHPSSFPEEENSKNEISLKEKEKMETKAESDFEDSQPSHSTCVYLLAKDLHLELDLIFHKASLLLLQLNAASEIEMLDRIKNNRVSKALFLIQKAAVVHRDPFESSRTSKLLQEASTLIEKAGVEERKVYMSTCQSPSESKRETKTEGAENPPPPPILLSRTDHSFTFLPAPYNLEEQVCWYQLYGRLAEGINRKVRLGDCSLPGTGNMVPAVSGECVLKVEGLEPNQKYVFAVAAYNSQGRLLGNAIGGTTVPVLASVPVSLLSSWAHLAQVAFQTEQYAIAKRACGELWSHYTCTGSETCSPQDRFATTGIHRQTLHRSSLHLCQLFLSSVFIETEINIQQGSLYCNSFSENGPFVWEQEARLAECERALVAMDLAMYLNDGSAALQAAVICYGLLAPLIFHQVICLPVVQVLKKCLVVLEENSSLLKQKRVGNTSESFMHMVACITYYLSKALRILRQHEAAAAVMDCGRKLLQEVYDAQRASKGLFKVDPKISLQLMALHEKDKRRIPPETVPTTENVSGCEDLSLLYELISSSTLNDAYQHVMTLTRNPYFAELSALLLQRAMEEGHPNLVLDWGKAIFQILSSSKKVVEGSNQTKGRNNVQASKGNDAPQQNKDAPSPDELRKRVKQKMPHSMLKKVRTNREMHLVENLLKRMSFIVRRNKKQLQLRQLCRDQSVWRSHLNYRMAQAHLALLYQGLDKLHGGALQHRYNQFDPWSFSLANSGVMVQRSSQRHQSSKHADVLERLSSQFDTLHLEVQKNKTEEKKDGTIKKDVHHDDSAKEESSESEEESSKPVEEQVETQGHAVAFLDSLNKVALHLRRAMVLAHRGSHWISLQFVCQTVWDQNSAITLLVQRTSQLEGSPPITADQLHGVFSPLLVLATDLIMDMLNRLGLWSLYDKELTEEELETSLHLSAPLDDNTRVDLRWVRTLVLHTLEELHDSGRWETLAHFGLLFNSYTRERYAVKVIPLLVDAQRRLLERISSFEGPAVPQPHHVKTHQVTGNQVTCRSYADCQLLSGWRPHAAQKPANSKKVSLNSSPQQAARLKDAEIMLSMSRVCVPLDVEDTLRCYNEALERKPHCLQVFQHGRSLLVRLLAHTQPCFVAQFQHCESRGLSHSASQVEFSPLVKPTPNIQSSDLTEEDFSTPNAVYALPISPDHMPTVVAAYSTAIRYLQANNRECLTVQALHEIGNLHFYNGNTRAAQSSWSKAVDCALQCSGVVDTWDGVSYGGGSMQQTLRQAGIWGCLQAAVLSAKIAQYILTFDISQRTTCCLLSAHLFKCVLSCCMAQPQSDLQYASHSIVSELLPGTDLFSEPHRNHVSTTVTSLSFVCHWLFTKGYYITVLPVIALHMHFVCNVCRDVQRTVDCKILKIRVLTHLCLFTEAVKEACQLTQGSGVLLPYGHYIAQASPKPVKTFCSDKSLPDNAEALEELVNCDFTPEVRTLYGPTLCVRFNLARAELVLALADSECGSAVPASDSAQFGLVASQQQEGDTKDTETSSPKTEEPNITAASEKQKHSLESIQSFLREAVSSLLQSVSQQLSAHVCSEMENLELTIELNLLKAKLHLQQGHAALSTEVAVSSLKLLQTSRGLDGGSMPGLKHVSDSSGGQNVDCPRAVEASERVGASLWLRCRLALYHSLTAASPGNTPLLPGQNHNDQAALVLHEGIKECTLWGEHDTQALLMVEGAELEAKRGRSEGSMVMLQKAVSMLSGRTHMPPGSIVTLARATLLLSDLRGVQSTTLLQLTQKLLKNQLSVFGQRVTLVDGRMCVSTPGPNNIYLPYLQLLNQTTLQIGHNLAHEAKGSPVTDLSSRSTSRQSSQQSKKPQGSSSP